jgi:hypothetical protein
MFSVSLPERFRESTSPSDGRLNDRRSPSQQTVNAVAPRSVARFDSSLTGRVHRGPRPGIEPGAKRRET